MSRNQISYCVKERKQTECVPGSEVYKKARNGRNMMQCLCASCGIKTTSFIKGQEGGISFTDTIKFMKKHKKRELRDAPRLGAIPFNPNTMYYD